MNVMADNDHASHRGRPRKKPGYNRGREVQELIQAAADLFEVPYDDREPRDQNAPTLLAVAEEMQTTTLRVRKLLITANMYSTETARNVQEMTRRGMTIGEIMKQTALGHASVSSYLPYKKGAYDLDNPTLYSEQGKRYRARKKAVKELAENLEAKKRSEYFWKCVIAFEGYVFQTVGRGKREGMRFRYEVSREHGTGGRQYAGKRVPGYGNEILTDGKAKSISRSTAELALKNALEARKRGEVISGPRKLGVPGAGSYLYAMLKRFEILE